MQASLYFTPSSSPHFLPTKPLASTWKSSYRSQTTRSPLLIRLASTPNDTSMVDYSSTASVFPAEACDTVGGDACAVEMFPEAKLKPEPKGNIPQPETVVEREYLEYDSPKTVFPEEACDDLGGEFCDPEYQKGVK